MFTLNKKSRTIIIITLSVLSLSMIVCALLFYLSPGYEDSKETTLKGTATANIDYSVIMDKNPVYDDTIVTDEKYYLKPFTNLVDVDCVLNITSDKEADIYCTSEVYGLLISEITTEDGKDIVWEKRYDYSPLREESATGTSLNTARHVNVKLDNYEELTSTLINEYNILTDYYLRITFDTSVTITSNGVSETEYMTTYLDIPFNDNVMEITNSSPTVEEVLMQKDIRTPKEPNHDLIILFLIFFAASVVSLIIMIFRTKGVDKKDVFTSQVERIFKEYGNRLAGLTETLSYQSSVMISIDKMEDMVKIADEIGQTIFYYEVDEEEERKIEFYVFDEGRIYYLVIFGSLEHNSISD